MSAKMAANGIRTYTRTNQRHQHRARYIPNIYQRIDVSGWCRHGFESHSKPFLLTYFEVDLSL